MKWKKLGKIFSPQDVNRNWMVTHAMDPVADHIKDDIYRIYFCGRNASNQSLIGFVEINLNDPFRILYAPQDPVLTLGELGSFDDNGVTASWIVNYQNKKYLYYIGWKPRSTTRFGLMTGLAISSDSGKTFTRYSNAPILNLTNLEPYSILTAPCVLKEGNIWKMWYVSCTGWLHADLPKYNIKYATSNDGIYWKQDGIVCIDYKNENETALARPSVLFEDNRYKMWYSFKDPAIGYRMGYAESLDGISWVRMDEQVGIDVSLTGWDSEMIQYPYVFNHKKTKYMLYNGNEYGKDGVGLAILSNE